MTKYRMISTTVMMKMSNGDGDDDGSRDGDDGSGDDSDEGNDDDSGDGDDSEDGDDGDDDDGSRDANGHLSLRSSHSSERTNLDS